jgi:hypothetical protein
MPPRKNISPDTATVETTQVTRFTEEKPIDEIKRVENNSPESGNSPIFVKTGETAEETFDDDNDFVDNRGEIERFYDYAIEQNLNVHADISSLPNYELDQRTDSRCTKERLGNIPFSLFLEDAVQNKYGPGIYLIELKTTENRFFGRLSEPLRIGKPKSQETPAPIQPPPIQPQPNQFSESVMQAQQQVFDNVLKLANIKTQAPEPPKSLADQAADFAKFKDIFQPPPPMKDEFTELAKTLLKERLSNPDESSPLQTDNAWATVLAPAAHAAGEALPMLASAALEYFTSSGKEKEQTIEFEREKLKAELIKRNQDIELERLRLQHYQIENGIVPDGYAYEPVGNELKQPAPQTPQQTQPIQPPQPTEDEMKIITDKIAEVINACKENKPVDEFAKELVTAMNESQKIKIVVRPYLVKTPENLLKTLQVYVEEDLSAIPEVLTWLESLQTKTKDLLKTK